MTENGPPPSVAGKIPSVIDKLPVALSIAASSMYVAGFAVVNGYLGSYGVYDLRLLDSRYFLAGVIGGVYSAVLYFFVLRKLRGRFTLPSMPMVTMRDGFLRGIRTPYNILETVFDVIWITIWLATTTFSDTRFLDVVLLVMLLGYAVDSYLLGRHAYAHFPILARLLSGLLFSLTIFLFFDAVSLGQQGALNLFLLFIGATFVFGMITSTASFKERVKLDTHYTWFYLSFTALTTLIAFGSTCYPFISSKFGGGAPSSVRVVYSETASNEIKTLLRRSAGPIRLLGETEQYYVFTFHPPGSSKATTIRLEKTAVSAIITEPPQPADISFLNFGRSEKESGAKVEPHAEERVAPTNLPKPSPGRRLGTGNTTPPPQPPSGALP